MRGTNINIIGGGCKGGSTIGRTKSNVVITTINNTDLNPKTFLINANDQLET